MIESLQRISLQWRAELQGVDGDHLQAHLKHKATPRPEESAVDITYQVQLVDEAAMAAQLDVTYRVIYEGDAFAQSKHAQNATWPYLRMDVLQHVTSLGIEGTSLLPVGNPLALPANDPAPSPPPVVESNQEVILPEQLRTELRFAAVMMELGRGGQRWLQTAAHLYLALTLLADQRRKLSSYETASLDLLLQDEVGCSIADVRALPTATRRRLRSQARSLMIVAVHAVMERGADSDTGVIRDSFDSSLEDLFSSGNEAEVEGAENAAGSATPPSEVGPALTMIIDPFLQAVKHFRHHSAYAVSRPNLHGATIITYAVGFDFATLRRLENVGHTRHLMGIYAVLDIEALEADKVFLSHVEDVSEDFERWAAEYDVLSRSEDDQRRLRHVEFLNSQPSPIPRRTLADLGAWAADYADESTLNEALLNLTLTPEALMEAAGLENINMWHVVRHRNCPESLLRLLARHPEEEVREEVAGCATAPHDLLLELYQDSDDVRRSMALNPNLPIELQRRLVHSADDLARAYVAGNQNLDPTLLEHLAGDPFEGTRENVASNARTPENVLTRLLNDPVEVVRTAAKSTLEERSPRS